MAESDLPLAALIVDDVPGMAEVARWHAADLGFRTVVVGTVAAARREIAADRFAVAVVDWRLPDGSGSEVLAALAERSPETFRVMYSAHAEAEGEATAVAAHDVVDKGEAVAALRHALRRGERFARGLARTAARLAPPVGWAESVRRIFPPAGSVAILPDVGRVPPDLLRWAGATGADEFPVAVDLLASPPPTADWLVGTLAVRGALDQPAGVTLLARHADEWPAGVQQVLAEVLHAQAIRRTGADRLIPTRVRCFASVADESALARLHPELRRALALVRLPAVADSAAALAELSAGRLTFSADAADLVRAFGFPWNLAELNAAVLACPAGAGEITLARLGVPVLEAGVEATPPPDLRAARAGVERFYLRALVRIAGSVTRAAEAAGMSRQAVHRLLSE